MKDGTVIKGQHFSHDEIKGRVSLGNELYSTAQDGPRPYIKCDSDCEYCEKEDKA